jgi:hypothetical protein
VPLSLNFCSPSVTNSGRRLVPVMGKSLSINRCSKSPETSNNIALVLLDFAGTARMCGISKGVDADGRTSR